MAEEKEKKKRPEREKSTAVRLRRTGKKKKKKRGRKAGPKIVAGREDAEKRVISVGVPELRWIRRNTERAQGMHGFSGGTRWVLSSTPSYDGIGIGTNSASPMA
ncbi:hypothetical protein ACM7YY_31535 [Pseudomonas aeruginosa]